MVFIKKKNPKYSIIIPTKNGFNYLPTCVRTIIDQEYSDYELIISNDHSDDGTKQYLDALSHPNIRIVEPPESLSMAEHWEWALSHAQGDWLIFVGQDDGLQHYFFQLADRLTEIANKKNLRAIMSERAYFFWKGCSFAYGDVAVSYTAINKLKIHNSKFQAIKALLGIQRYFELPQMYTTSLFKKSLLDEARIKQEGKVFVSHPQDANLAAIACSIESGYLKSYIPLGWVGTSPKSAGMAISHAARKSENPSVETNGLTTLKKEYEEKIAKSNFKYPNYAGDFSFGNTSIYFWQALLQTKSLRHSVLNRVINSQVFKILMFSGVLFDLIRRRKLSTHRYMYMEILRRNHCNFVLVLLTSLIVFLGFPLWKLSDFLFRAINKVKHLLFGTRVFYIINWAEDQDMDMIKASSIVMKLLNKNTGSTSFNDIRF